MLAKLLERFPAMPQSKKSLALGCVAFYAIVETAAYFRWRSRVKMVEEQPILGLHSKYQYSHWETWFCREMMTQPRPREMLETMFQAPLHRISRERALHFLCFYLSMRELESYSGNAYPDAIVESGLRILTEFEKTGQFKLHSDPATAWLHESTPTEAIVGANTSVVDFIRIGRGSINAFYKPLAVQITLSIARLYAEREMREMGFVRSVGNNNVVFWIKEFRRTGDESPSTARPLFFFHGLGFGIVPYIHFIRTLVDDRRTMVVPEWPNISLGWKDNTRDEGLFSHHYAEALSAVVKTLKNSDGTGATTIDVIGHSYGTIVMNFIHAHLPLLMVRRVYMDCILFGVSFHKFTVFSAEYAMHSWKKLLKRADWKEVFGTWFVKGDLSVQHLNRRTTHLAESLLSHPHAELNEECLFVLSGKDVTIPTYDIYSYITNNNLRVRVEIDPDWVHGGFLFQPDPLQLWQMVNDWVAPKNKAFRRVRSHSSLRGHLFAAGS